MDLRCEDFLSAKRLVSAGIDTDIRPSECRQYAAGVGRRVWQMSIPVAGADAEEVQGRMMCSDENCEYILFAAIRLRFIKP
jgi:hypothetical protein